MAAFKCPLTQRLKTSRKQLFEDTEKQALSPLPSQRYIIRKFKGLKAQFNYHVYLSEDKHYYSVPYRYRGKQMLLVYGNHTVEIFYNNQRVALHRRDRTANAYTTVKEHMPSHHQAMTDWNPQRLLNWASNLGEYVEAVVSHILKGRQHPEQAYKSCLGILSLTKKFDKERLNKACRKAMEFQHFSYKGIKNILENRLEDYQLDCFESPNVAAAHPNIRGNQYYK